MRNLKIIELLTGSLLGDCSGYRSGIKENGPIIFKFVQGPKNHLYIKWLHNKFKNLGVCNPEPLKEKFRLINDKLVGYYSFQLYANHEYEELYNQFYGEGKKKVPFDLIERYFSVTSLAIWIMDDGAKTPSGVVLCTDSFTKSESEWLSLYLKRKFDLDCSLWIQNNEKNVQIKDRKKDCYRIYIRAQSLKTLQYLVKPHMAPSMLYKIHL